MRPTIHVIDDDADACTILNYLFEEHYEVRTSLNAADGLIELAQGECDLLLIDFHMPDLDGVSVVRIIKQIRELSNIPVIAITAVKGKEIENTLLRSGVDKVFFKPINNNELLDLVHQYLH